MISVICAYNNEQTFKTCLLKSLSEQKTNCEIIAIDNTKSRFKSAAEAFNWGAATAAGDYLMFVHQDIDLYSDSWFDGTEELLDSLPDLGIAGVAGISVPGWPSKKRRSYTIHRTTQAQCRNVITHGPQRERWGTPIQAPEPVQTLDECLVIIPKSIYKIMQFDEVTCDSWHLYAADYCLSVAELGFGVYAIPRSVYHQSKGYKEPSTLRTTVALALPEEYYRTLEHVLKKHKDHYKWIHTSVASWNTTYPLGLQKAKLVIRDFIVSRIFKNSCNG